jgi:predicted lactoylglutathione lyase
MFELGGLSMFTHIQPFLPTIDFKISKQFYLDLGFEIVYEDEQLSLFKKDQISFFIQHAYVKDWAENLMIQAYYSSIDVLYEQVESLKTHYPMIKIKHPFQAPYGYTFHLLDPAGVLWHFTDPNKK